MEDKKKESNTPKGYERNAIRGLEITGHPD